METIESEIGTIQRFALGLVGLLSLKSEHDKKCYQCCRSYASSQSLWNHKQRCKGNLQGTISSGSGLQMIHYQAFHILIKRKQMSEDLKWKKPKSDYEKLTRFEEDDYGDEDDLGH